MKNDKCQHKYNLNQANFSFCSRCGIIIYGNETSCKSSKYNVGLDNSPLINYKIMKASVETFPPINLSQVYINQRNEIIKELKIFFNKLLLKNQTFYLAIHMMDIIALSKKETNYKLIGFVCLGLAAKFDEKDLNASILTDFEYACRGAEAYSLNVLKSYEVQCLKHLDYKLDYVTPYHFINFFTIHGFVFTNDELIDSNLNNEIKRFSKENLNEFFTRLSDKVYYITKEVLYHFFDNSQYLKFNSIDIACSCISISREINKLKDFFPHQLEIIFKLKSSDFAHCVSAIKSVISSKTIPNSELSKYFSVQKSHSSTVSPDKYKMMKRNSLTINYEGQKIISTIEDKESLNKLNANEVAGFETTKIDENSSRCPKRKQSYVTKGETLSKLLQERERLRLGEKSQDKTVNISAKKEQEFNSNDKSESKITKITKEINSFRTESNNKKRSLNIKIGLPNNSEFKEVSDDDIDEHPARSFHSKFTNNPILPISFLMNRNKLKNFQSSNCVAEVIKRASNSEKLTNGNENIINSLNHEVLYQKLQKKNISEC